MKINCLVRLWFFLAAAISVLLADSLFHWLALFALWIGLVLINISVLKPVWLKIRPYLFYLPVMVVLYTGFSLLMTDNTLQVILYQGGFAFIKLFLMISIMSIYFQWSESGDVLDALRSLWSKTGLGWRFVDDFFIYLELTLRFFPTFQRDWDYLRQSRHALGLKHSGKRFTIIKQTAADLPGLLFQSLGRADEIAMSIKLRGYGTVSPRGVAHPIELNFIDGVLFIVTTFLFYWSNFVFTV